MPKGKILNLAIACGYLLFTGSSQAEDSAIDREPAVNDYVLSDFSRQEKKIIDSAILEVSRALHCLLTEGIGAAMNKYN